MENPQILGFAYTLGLEIHDLKQFFKALSLNGTRSVDLPCFVDGCIRSRGHAKSLDMVELQLLQKQTEIVVYELIDDILMKQQKCETLLQSILVELRNKSGAMLELSMPGPK